MKKAKIDVLDIADSFDEKPAELLRPYKPDAEEPQIDLESESALVLPQEADVPKRWRYLTWKTMVLFGIPSICLVLIVVAVVAYFVYYDKKSVSSAAKGAKEVPTIAATANPVYFDNLTALINDLSGKQRVVVFGMAVIPGKGANPNIKGGDQDVRIGASRIVSGSLFPELLNDQGRNQIKKKMKAHIENLKGAGTVESVWITSWTIL